MCVLTIVQSIGCDQRLVIHSICLIAFCLWQMQSHFTDIFHSEQSHSGIFLTLARHLVSMKYAISNTILYATKSSLCNIKMTLRPSMHIWWAVHLLIETNQISISPSQLVHIFNWNSLYRMASPVSKNQEPLYNSGHFESILMLVGEGGGGGKRKFCCR